MDMTTPVSEFEAFVKEGGYNTMKQHETFLKQAKDHLKQELIKSEEKRRVFPEINMVAKFVAKEIRSTNEEGLIQDLFDYVKPEMALLALTLNPKKMKDEDVDRIVKSYRYPDTYYVRPYLNKNGKKHLSVRDYLFGGQTTDQLLTEIRDVTKLHNEIGSRYVDIRYKLQSHLDKTKEKRLATSVGSISRIAHSPEWNMKDVLENLGEDFIQVFGSVNLSLLDEWVLTGKIPRKIITDNREITDIRLDFTVIPLDVEARIINYSNQRKSDLSLSRYA